MTDTFAHPAQQPSPTSTRGERMRAPLATLAGLTLATLALHLRDPHESGSWGVCPMALVGLACPGCGGLRAVNDLTNGDLIGAASSNLAFIVALPFLVSGLLLWSSDRWRGHRRHLPMSMLRPAAFVVLALLLAFTVLRNLAVGSWLAP